MAKSTKPKMTPAPETVGVAPNVPAIQAPLADLTPEALKARADEWDAARENLKTAGDAASVAQASFDALPEGATDEQRDDALRALAEAENEVKTAEATIKALSEPTAFAVDGTISKAIISGTEAGLSVRVTGGDDATAADYTYPVLQYVDQLIAEGDVLSAKDRLETELADARETIANLEAYASRIADRLAGLTTPPDPPKVETGAGAGGTQRFRVTGPKAGRWRAGQYWGPEPVEAELTYEAWMALTGDSAFIVESLDDGT